MYYCQTVLALSCTTRTTLSQRNGPVLVVYYSHYPVLLALPSLNATVLYSSCTTRTIRYLLERLAIGHAHDDEKETVVDNTEGELERLKGGRGMARG